MKLRAKTNGNVIERDGDEAEALLAAGIYERVDDEADETKDMTPEKRPRGSYKRRDMSAEK